MPKKKKDVIKVTYTIDKEVACMVDEYNEKTDIPKSKIVEKSVKAYLEKELKKDSTKE